MLGLTHDVRRISAEGRAATAGIGVARAQLYPSIRLGARFGSESCQGSEFLSWGSRLWSIGPSLDLPLFDRGRRKSVVQLRELEQHEAVVTYQRTVLSAWKEIDDALTGYTAEQQQRTELVAREQCARRAADLAQARYEAGRWTSSRSWIANAAICKRDSTWSRAKDAFWRDTSGSIGRWATRRSFHTSN